MKNKRGIKNVFFFLKLKERVWKLFSKINCPTWNYGSSNSAKQTNINLSIHYLNNWNIWLKLDLLTFKKNTFLLIFIEKGRESERETWITCILYYLCWGSSPQPRHVPWPRIKSVISQCMGICSTNWATMARDFLTSIIIKV